MGHTAACTPLSLLLCASQQYTTASHASHSTLASVSGAPQTAQPGQSGLGLLVQGSIESSNVNVVEELVNMIETQRAYEMNSKAISTGDQMLQHLNNNL